MKKSQHCFAVAKVPVKAIAMAIILAHGTEVHARELHVCPDTAPDCQSIYSFDWAGVNADDKVVLHGGIYSQPIVISNVASGAEIVPGEGDVYINGMVAFVNSKYVRWIGNQRIHIQDTDSPGIAIVQGSAHLAIAGTDISNTGLGIWIAQGAGCGHYLFSNTIKNNQTHGIAIDKINCRADNRTQIFENTIIENHYHGIELNGNYYNVIANRVARNGGGAVGTNGIHVVSGNPSEGTGQYNEIRSNIVHENADIDLNGADGSGIKLDRYTRFNTVSDNVIFKKAGSKMKCNTEPLVRCGHGAPLQAFEHGRTERDSSWTFGRSKSSGDGSGTGTVGLDDLAGGSASRGAGRL